MIGQFLPILLGAVVAGVIGIVIAWVLIGRLVKQPAWLRTTLRLGVTVGIIALAVLLVSRLRPTPPGGGAGGLAGQPGAARLQTLTPAETATVEQDSLTITMNSTGSLSPAQQVELAFELSDPVVEVLVEEGQRVAAGDVVARLDPTDAEAAVRDAEIALAQAQADYDDLTQPPRDVDVAVAEANVALAEASLYSASSTGPDATDEEIARLNVELARNQLWQSQLNRDIVQGLNPEFRSGNGGANAQDIQQNSQVQSQEYNVQIQETTYDGTLNEGPDAGSLASANASLVQAQVNLEELLNPASAAELRRAEIDLAIDETDIVNVQVGQRVELSVDALPGAEITGTVTKISSAPTIEGQLVTYTATVTLDPTTSFLRPGLSATATIITSELENAIIVPNRFIRIDSETQRTFVTVAENGQYREVAVEIGARNEAESQILSGLQAGQTIVLLPSQTQTQAGATFGGGPPGSGGQGGN